MARPILSSLQQRYLDLVGDSDGTIDSFGTRNINAAISEILNRYAFSWALRTDNLTLATGASDLPADYNPTWGVFDARIVAASSNDDNIFTRINVADRDSYSASDYVYWITYDAAGDDYVFNTLTQTGTVAIYYYTNYVGIDTTGTTWKTALAVSTDYTIVPESEAVSYLAASKNWIGSERDIELAKEYKQTADQLITAMYLRDIQDTELPFAGTVSFYNLT